MSKYLFIFFSLILSSKIVSQNSFISDSIDKYIEKGLKEWKIPGLAIVIVKDGKVVLRKGYGVKDIESNEKVNEDTHFFIASNTKLFTGCALAKLAYENKINLNDPIVKYFPEYKLYDEISTKLVTVKDMLTHRLGTKTFQGDFTFWNSKLSREEIMNKMKFLKPNAGFRDSYGYCNSCFLVAGQVIEKAIGEKWEDHITSNFLLPIDMKSTYALSNDITSRSKNIASPYTTSYSNELKKVPYDVWDNLGPAASIVSNVVDLTKWLNFQLDSGKVNSKVVMPWKAMQMTRDILNVTSSRKSSFYPVHIRGYGLGLFSSDYNGKQIYWHTGGAAGMVSNVCFVPEVKLGIAILTNNDNQNFFEALRYQILDSYLNMPFIDRSKAMLVNHNTEMSNVIDEIKILKKDADLYAGKVKSFDSFKGIYNNELYGQIELTPINSGLKISFEQHPNLSANLYPMNENDWVLEYNNIEYGVFKTQFQKSEKGIKSLIIKMNEFVEIDSYEFIKI
ncbi:MAG: hypothetical protein RLZZ546_3125 [Bacteroidota bacterium]